MLLLTQAVVLEEVVKLADDRFGPFPTITSFITQKVDLSGNGLTCNSKYSTLPRGRGQEVDGTWVVHLKRKKVGSLNHTHAYMYTCSRVLA